MYLIAMSHCGAIFIYMQKKKYEQWKRQSKFQASAYIC